jgi:periplasmic copper chaperone A
MALAFSLVNQGLPMTVKTSLIAALFGCALIASASAQVTVKDAWVRATVPQQKATGAFMQITAATDARLVAASSSAVPLVEVHEMVMDNNVMKMRQIPALELPAGKRVELKPGGYHLMLLELKQQMKPGDTLPLTLVFEDKAGKRESVDIKAEVRALNAAAAQPTEHKH